MPNIIIGVAIAILVLIALYLFLIAPAMFRKVDRKPFLNVWYAHRGFHDNKTDAPENSLRAFGYAVERGYGIELDVQLTKDEKVVVFHDNDLRRVCGINAPVNAYTFEELQQFSLLSSDQKIPLFTDVLDVIGGKVPLIVEIKMVDDKTRVCELANDILVDYKGLYCVESFHPFAVRWFKEHRPDILRGQLSCNFIKEGDTKERFFNRLVHWLHTNFLTRPDFIAYSCLSADNLSFRLCKLMGALPVAWTIKSRELLDKSADKFQIFIFEGFTPDKKD